MAYLRPRKRSDGTTAYGVFFRDAETGKQSSKTFEEPGEADLLLRFLNANRQSFRLAEQAVVNMRSTVPTVAAATLHHIDSLTGVEPGTVESYRSILRNHIEGTILGATPVDKLTPRMVGDWFAKLDRSAKTKRNIHALLSAALARAAQEGHADTNPAKGVRPPKSSAKTRQPVYLSRTEVDLIAETINPHFALFIRFLAGTGLRFGEATALSVRDIKNRNRRMVVVVHAGWKRHAGKGVGQIRGATKTVAGDRPVTLPAGLANPMQAHMAGKHPDAYLFTYTNGNRIINSSIHEYHWQPTMKKLAKQLHDRPTIHDLRHTHASRLIEAGVPLPVIQARLGHESIQTTIGTYGHLATDADAKAADLLD